MNKLYIHLDFFSPSVYFKSPGNTADGPIFLCLQPYIFGDPSMGCPDLVEYIQDISSETNPKNYEFVILDEMIQSHRDLNIWDDNGTFDSENFRAGAIPVPFPWNTNLTREGNRINAANATELGFRFKDAKAKVQWMIYSMSSVTITAAKYFNELNYKYFDNKHIDKWWNTIQVVLNTYVEKNKNGDYQGIPTEIFTDPILKFKIDPARRSLYELLKLLEQYRQEKKEVDTEEKKNAIRNYLKSLDTIFINHSELIPKLDLPKITLVQKDLEDLLKEDEALVKKVVPGPEGYLKNVCRYFLTVFEKSENKEDNPTSKNKRAGEVIEALRTYFLFGERTRLQKDWVPKDFNIMRVEDQDAVADKDLISTAVVSLLGQVIDLSNNGTYRLNNTEVTNTNFADNVNAIRTNTRDNTGDSFVRTLSTMNSVDWNSLIADPNLQQDFNDNFGNLGKASFIPANAVGVQSELYPKVGAFDVFNIPQSIFDGLEKRGRFSYTGYFARKNPQRKSVEYPTDIFNYHLTAKGTAPINNYLFQFTPAIMIKVQANEVPLFGVDKNILYKFSAKVEHYDSKIYDAEFRQYIEQTVLANLGNFVFTLLDPGSDGLEFSPMSDDKMDSDELIEIYAFFEKGKIKKQQYDLLIYPKPEASAWQSTVHFNVLLKPNATIQPILIHRDFFHFKFNQSSNGFNSYLRMELKKSPSFKDLTGNLLQPILNDHSAFNKFRTQIKKSDGAIFSLNKADALRPIYEYVEGDPAHSSDIVAYYKILHRFSEELAGFKASAMPEGFETESTRYLLYKSTGQPKAVFGKTENQYAFRLHTQESDPVKLNNSGDLANPALLAINDQSDKSTTIHALTYQVLPDTKKLEVRLNKNYFDLFNRQNNPENGKNYRQLYESFIDFIFADSIELQIEGWEFDNTLFDLPASLAVHPELANEIPSHQPYLRPYPANMTLDITPFLLIVKKHFDQPDFQQFAQAVKNFKIDIAQQFEIPTVLQDTSFLRLRLTLFRDPKKTIATNFNGTVTSNDLIMDKWQAMQSVIDKKEYNVDVNPPEVNARAVSRLTDLITLPDSNERLSLPIGSGMFFSAAFIAVVQSAHNQTIIKTPKINEQIKLVLSENTTFTAINFPLDAPVVTQPPKDYGQLYYIPYAATPIQTIEEIGNVTESYLFVEYLLKIMIALAYPSKATEDLKTLVGNIKWDTTSDERAQMFKLVVQARLALAAQIAPKLASMITYVDDRDIERIPGTDTLPDSYKVLTSIYQSIDFKKTINQYFTSLFTAKPELFLSSKGYGVGLVRNEFESGGMSMVADFGHLYSIKIDKIVIRSKAPAVPMRKLTSVFDFTSIYKCDPTGRYKFFVDVLDDEMYDNEFEILHNESSPTTGISVKNHRRIMSTNNNYVDVSAQTENIDLVHYVPDWTEKKTGRKLYLLPSRRPPQKPVEQKFFEKIYFKNSLKPASEFQKQQLRSMLFAELDSRLREKHVNDGYPQAQTGTAAETRVTAWTLLNAPNNMKRGYITSIQANQISESEWKRFDNFISIYTFAIEPDEEGTLTTHDTPLNGFQNDVIKVYSTTVDLNRSRPSATERRFEPGPFKSLFESYNKRAKGEREIPDVDINTIFDTTNPEQGLIKTLNSVLVPITPGQRILESTDYPLIGEIVVTKEGEVGGFRLSKAFGSMVGTMLYADVDLKTGKTLKYFLSVAVLVTPWEHTKLCIQVDRNSRDYDSDGDPDINPAFQMFSEYSEWADHGKISADYNFWDGEGEDNKQLVEYPDQLRAIVYDNVTQQNYDENLKQNLDKPLPDFFMNVLPADRFDKEQIKGKPIYIAVSHRSTTNQVIEVSKKLDSSFVSDLNAGLRAYRDQFVKQSMLFPVGQERAKLTLDDRVRASHPFIRVVIKENDDEVIELLSINLQLQWQTDK